MYQTNKMAGEYFFFFFFFFFFFTLYLPERRAICEIDEDTITCAEKPDTALNIIYANYGRTSRDFFDHPKIADTNCRAPSSLSIVRALCQDVVSCTLSSSNAIFGDPCNGVYKYLDVEFECSDPG